MLSPSRHHPLLRYVGRRRAPAPPSTVHRPAPASSSTIQLLSPGRHHFLMLGHSGRRPARAPPRRRPAPAPPSPVQLLPLRLDPKRQVNETAVSRLSLRFKSLAI